MVIGPQTPFLKPLGMPHLIRCKTFPAWIARCKVQSWQNWRARPQETSSFSHSKLLDSICMCHPASDLHHYHHYLDRSDKHWMKIVIFTYLHYLVLEHHYLTWKSPLLHGIRWILRHVLKTFPSLRHPSAIVAQSSTSEWKRCKAQDVKPQDGGMSTDSTVAWYDVIWCDMMWYDVIVF